MKAFYGMKVATNKK